MTFIEIPFYHHVFGFIEDVVRDKEVLFIDVGANEGQSIKAAHLYFRNLNRVIAYEPVKNNILDSLIDELKLRNKMVIYDLFNKAVGCEDLIEINLTDHSGLNSIYEINQDYNYGISNGRPNSKMLIPCVRLDNILKELNSNNLETLKQKKVMVLKIDVQGYEYNVLESGPSLINGLIDFVFIEIILVDKYNGQKNYLEIMKLLVDYGFVLLDFRPFLKQNKKQIIHGSSFGQFTEADAIYVHKKTIERLNLDLYEN
jgi:FkbM family methyltransferase